MAELSSAHGEERSSQETATGNDLPSTSSLGGKGSGSVSLPLEREIHGRQEARKCHGETLECSGVSTEPDRAFMSPGFRSAVALAGWDAETLLKAALFQSPINSKSPQGNVSSAQSSSQGIKDGLRKRDKRTPASSGRRSRKARWENSNGFPIGRVPMQPLTLLSDGEHDNKAGAKENGSGATTQGNRDLGTRMRKEENASNANGATSSMPPPCLDKLREELSCAVCLDICFEPSTISCGHSFCGTCLQSAISSCGPRCPKCRQTVRIEASRKHQTNTVLWNTIQILFPKECAVKLQDRKQSCDQVYDERKENQRPMGNMGTRLSRLQPWRGYEVSNSSDASRVTGNLSSSFLSASELLGRNRLRDRLNTFRPFGAMSTSARPTTRLGDGHAFFPEGRNPSAENVITRHRRGVGNAAVTQEEVDEDLARQLQEAELNGATSGDTTVAALATRRVPQRRRRQRS